MTTPRGRRPSRCRATRRPRASSSPASTRSAARTTRCLREALEKLHLNDASLTYEPESSVALGFGFRCGFLGLLHMEIVQERLEREFDLDLIASAPSVEYQVVLINGRGDGRRRQPGPAARRRRHRGRSRSRGSSSAWSRPSQYIGTLMELSTNRRGVVRGPWSTSTRQRVLLTFELPLAEVIVDFYDQLKSRTQGYASMDYEEIGYRPADLVKLDVLVAGEPVDALSLIVHRDKAQASGRRAGRPRSRS